MLNRTESVKNKIVDFVTAKERLLNPPEKKRKDRKREMLIAYANRRRYKFIGAPL